MLRDVDTMPIIAELQAGRLAYLASVEDGLAVGWGVRGRAARRLRATIGLALDFPAGGRCTSVVSGEPTRIAVTATAVRAAAETR